jgi:hypothetical protein
MCWMHKEIITLGVFQQIYKHKHIFVRLDSINSATVDRTSNKPTVENDCFMHYEAIYGTLAKRTKI